MLRVWESSRQLCEGEKTAVEIGRLARLQREDRRRYLLSDRLRLTQGWSRCRSARRRPRHLARRPRKTRANLLIRIFPRFWKLSNVLSAVSNIPPQLARSDYNIDVDRLDFIHPTLRCAIPGLERAPRLNAIFETSVSGLHFIGPASAMSFGSLFRFVVGAEYSARVVSAHLAARALSAA